MNIVAIIPARYSSTRFKGKPLVPINGMPMIQHVYERVRRCPLIEKAIVATDDERIIEAVRGFGGEAVLTSLLHKTGTDRLAEAADDLDVDIIVNVQGDEPLIEPEMLSQAIAPLLDAPDIPMSTLKVEMHDREDIRNPNIVKVVTDTDGYALYFSRLPIPFLRDSDRETAYFKHIGLYVYRKEFLLKFAGLQPTPLEGAEGLEQLRALEHGFRIKVVLTEYDTIGVDTPSDLKVVEERLSIGGTVKLIVKVG
ncbi:MAG: 3-deoxy-manno-octulosonate cytidylyltransferase [Thermodesulfobacteriota bacterium]